MVPGLRIHSNPIRRAFRLTNITFHIRRSVIVMDRSRCAGRGMRGRDLMDLMKDVIDNFADENVQESDPSGHGCQVIIKCHVKTTSTSTVSLRTAPRLLAIQPYGTLTTPYVSATLFKSIINIILLV